MTPDEFKQAAGQHVEWIESYFRNVRELPVLPSVAPGEVIASLPGSAPEKGEPIEQILADFDTKIAPALTLWNHPRFFAYFSVSSTPPTILADLLISALNVNAMLWKSSPAATELEELTLGWLRQWLGLSEAFFGLIYDTASTSVLHAIAAAREWICPECRTEGMRPGLTVYISEQTHSSAEKSAITLGFGQKNVRKIPVDSQFRMRPDLLEEAISNDIAAGLRPCCIVASIGSTSTAAIDPVPAIADIAERHGVWLHVDGAYAGCAAVLPEKASILDGVERAQSFVLNPHKWLCVSIDCSVFYTRHPDILRRAFSLSAEYLRTSEDSRAVNLMDYGMQLGRRFRALKLWYVFRSYGHEGIAAIVRESIRVAQLLRSWIEGDPDFELAAPVHFSLVCFRHKAGNDANERLLSAINTSGRAFLSHTVLNGRYTLRCAIGNFQTTEDDVRETWALVVKAAHELTGAAV